MSKFLKVSIHIFSVLAALILFSGCEEEYPDTPVVKLISISGVVADITDGEPVSGITVTMTGYDLEDEDKLNPLFSESYDTAFDGTYWFMKSDETAESLTGVYIDISLSDTNKNRSEHYKPAQRSIFLLSSSSFYNSVTQVYKVESNNFFVSK